MRTSGLLAAAVAVATALQGCGWLSPTKEELRLHGSSKKDSLTIGQLEREIQDLADRYSMGVAEACDRIRRQDAGRDIQRMTHFFKLRNANSAYDGVTSGDALEGLLDLVTLIELQNIVWVDEGRIAKLPRVPGTEFLRSILGSAREEAWALAARALTKDQVGKVRRVIQEWRQRNPDVQWVAFSRFSSGANASVSNLLNDIRSSLGGLLDPFGSAARSVDDTRELAAKALFYSKRLPMLLQWEAEAAAMGIADLPEVNQLEQDAAALSRAVTELPAEARSLVLWITGGATLILVAATALLLLYRRVSLGWERKYRAPPKPSTRALPVP